MHTRQPIRGDIPRLSDGDYESGLGFLSDRLGPLQAQKAYQAWLERQFKAVPARLRIKVPHSR
jgi:hypothetical protein